MNKTAVILFAGILFLAPRRATSLLSPPPTCGQPGQPACPKLCPATWTWCQFLN